MKYLKTLLNYLGYLVLFLVVYFAINAYRSPVAPAHLHLHSTDISAQSHALVYFWGSWCGICRTISPNIQALHDQNYPVISVAVSSGSDDDISRYMSLHGHDFFVINDEDGSLFKAWGGQVVPSFVIVRDGQAVQSFTGVAPLWSLKLRLWVANF